ncbi:MAG TPA: hypothetical protein VEP90_22925 [Methylomirabilota bacterium]|nr:hypothetical protein [Methylomirabilota bacterium]
MLAANMRDWGVELLCPQCFRWIPAKMNETKGHFETECWYCEITLAWGIEQDIVKGTFKGTASSE